jgi:hypothetical protein
MLSASSQMIKMPVFCLINSPLGFLGGGHCNVKVDDFVTNLVMALCRYYYTTAFTSQAAQYFVEYKRRQINHLKNKFPR